MIIAAVTLIEIYANLIQGEGFSGWKIYLLIALALFSFFMIYKKRKERNNAPIRGKKNAK